MQSGFAHTLYTLIPQNPAILCLGTDKSVGDCLAPLCGMFLSARKNMKCVVYGCLDYPVHRENLQFTMDEIRFLDPRAPLVTVDAPCTASRAEIGNIMLFRGAAPFTAWRK